VQIEALEAVLEQERSDSKARSSRQKLTVERLRQQIVELQVCILYIHSLLNLAFQRQYLERQQQQQQQEEEEEEEEEAAITTHTLTTHTTNRQTEQTPPPPFRLRNKGERIRGR
jgi:hypothetical protein